MEMEKLSVFDITICFEQIAYILSRDSKEFIEHLNNLNKNRDLDCILIIFLDRNGRIFQKAKEDNCKILGLKKTNRKNIIVSGLGRPIRPKKLPDLDIIEFSKSRGLENKYRDVDLYSNGNYDIYYNYNYKLQFNIDGDLHKSLMIYLKKYIINK
jgi:hypothetical protein